MFSDATATNMPPLVDRTLSLVQADVDGDGSADILVGNIGRNRVLLNDGTGSFRIGTALPPVTASQTFALVGGDFDGDGDVDADGDLDLDLVVANHGQNSLWLNGGAGTFTDATATNLPTELAVSFAVGLQDCDGDGDLDLVVGNMDDHNSLATNDGLGRFTLAAGLPALRDRTMDLALGDMDGDGDIDIVFANDEEVSPPSRLMLNDGAAGYTDATDQPLQADIVWTGALALEDLDGDGDPDLVCGSEYTLDWSADPHQQRNRLYLNDGRGRFADVTATNTSPNGNLTHAVVAGDNDGDLDLVKAGPDVIYRNSSFGFFNYTVATSLGGGGFAMAVAVADVDGDGYCDILLGGSGQNRLYRNHGRGDWGFTDVTSSWLPRVWDRTEGIACGGVDGDGDPDIVVGNGDYLGPERNRLYLNDRSNSRFVDVTATHLPPTLGRTRSLAFGDIDEDGDLDLYVGDSDGADALLLNDGTGRFVPASAQQFSARSNDTCAVAMRDTDGDGDLDLVLGQIGADQVMQNLRRQAHAPCLARIGHEYRIDFYAKTPGATSDALLGVLVNFSPGSLAFPPFGTLGLSTTGLIALPGVLVDRTSGQASFVFLLPAAALGHSIYFQGLVFPSVPARWGAGRFTNVVHDRVVAL